MSGRADFQGEPMYRVLFRPFNRALDKIDYNSPAFLQAVIVCLVLLIPLAAVIVAFWRHWKDLGILQMVQREVLDRPQRYIRFALGIGLIFLITGAMIWWTE